VPSNLENMNKKASVCVFNSLGTQGFCGTLFLAKTSNQIQRHCRQPHVLQTSAS
jgi:hypothetical protein